MVALEDGRRRGHRDSTVDVTSPGRSAREDRLARHGPRLSRSADRAPDDRGNLRRVVGQLGRNDARRDGAVLMERLLAVGTPDAAPISRAGSRRCGGPPATEGRAAHARARAPLGARRHAIHDRLRWYRDHARWGELAGADDPRRRADARLAASIGCARPRACTPGFFGQPLEAAEVLRKARQRAPRLPPSCHRSRHRARRGRRVDAAQRAIGEALRRSRAGAHRALAAALRTSASSSATTRRPSANLTRRTSSTRSASPRRSSRASSACACAPSAMAIADRAPRDAEAREAARRARRSRARPRVPGRLD